MKKVFLIFLFLTIALPAFAEDASPTPVAGEPTHADPATVATAQPGYALAMGNTEHDSKVATAGYVKGAYNATIKAINTVTDSIPASEPSLPATGRASIWVE